MRHDKLLWACAFRVSAVPFLLSSLTSAPLSLTSAAAGECLLALLRVCSNILLAETQGTRHTLHADVTLTEDVERGMIRRLMEVVEEAADAEKERRRQEGVERDIAQNAHADYEASDSEADAYETDGLVEAATSLSCRMLVALAARSPSSLSLSLSPPARRLAAWVRASLLSAPSPSVRKSAAEAVVAIIKNLFARGDAASADVANEIIQVVFGFFRVELGVLVTSPPPHYRVRVRLLRPDRYFSLLRTLLPHVDGYDVAERAMTWLRALPIAERRANPRADAVAVGLMDLLADAAGGWSFYEKWAACVWSEDKGGVRTLAASLMRRESDVAFDGGFAEYICANFLFGAPTQRSHSQCAPPLCKASDSRRSAFGLLSALCRGCPPAALFLCAALHSHHSPAPLSSRPSWLWSYLPTSSLRRCGPAGLENLGSTCYMNSLLQQLFAAPLLRLHLFGLGACEGAMEVDATSAGGEGQGKECGVLLSALQQLFVTMQETERAYVPTREFFTAYQVHPSHSLFSLALYFSLSLSLAFFLSLSFSHSLFH